MTVRCKKHPKYKALRPPRWRMDKASGCQVCCQACYQIWKFKTQANLSSLVEFSP